MMGKLSLLAGTGIGYLLGTKAGHQRYQQIMGLATKAWSSDPVQFKVETAKEAVRTRAPMIADKFGETAKLNSSKLTGKATGEELPGLADQESHESDGKVYADVSGFDPGPGNLA